MRRATRRSDVGSTKDAEKPEQSEAKFESPPAKKPSKQAARPEPKYSANEQVVSFDGALRGTQRHYYAKIKEVRFDDAANQWEYFVHWEGWNDRFDEWMTDTDTRLMPKNEETCARVEADKNKKKAAKTTKKPSSTGVEDSRQSTPERGPQAGGGNLSSRDSVASGPTTSTITTDMANDSTRKKGRSKTGQAAGGVDKQISPNEQASAGSQRASSTKKPPAHVESAAESARRVEVRIDLPVALKSILVDDSDYVNGDELMLLKIPAQHTVEKIINDYCDHLRAHENEFDKLQFEELEENAKLLIDYFNAALGRHLLYKFERPQYADLVEKYGEKNGNSKKSTSSEEEENEPAIRASRYYGFVHLLRLFVRLGSYMNYTSWSASTVAMAQTCIAHYLDWLAKHVNVYYTGEADYEATTLHYQKRVYET